MTLREERSSSAVVPLSMRICF